MRTEPAPVEAFVADFRAIWQVKHTPRRRRLQRLEKYILRRYCVFKANLDRLEAVPRRPWSPCAKDALRHCYDVEGQNLARLKKSFLAGLSDAARARCPYCMLRPPGSIDHFLPVDHFPEFAVLVLNWVYACDRCNRDKGTRLTGVPRSLLSPYFDPIPGGAPLLYAEVTIVGGVPKVTFEVPDPNPTLPDPTVVAIARRQFDALKLKPVLEIEAATVLNSTIGTIVHEANGVLTAEGLQDRLHARRANLEDLGINGWERRLCEAMEVCPALLGHVNSRITARPPKAPLPPPHDLRVVQLAQAIAAAGR